MGLRPRARFARVELRYEEFFKFRQSLLSRLCKKAGLVDNTRLFPHAKMLPVPMNCFLSRVDYALEENVLTKQL